MKKFKHESEDFKLGEENEDLSKILEKGVGFTHQEFKEVLLPSIVSINESETIQNMTVVKTMMDCKFAECQTRIKKRLAVFIVCFYLPFFVQIFI